MTRASKAGAWLACSAIAFAGVVFLTWYVAGLLYALAVAFVLIVAFGDLLLAGWVNLRAGHGDRVHGLVGSRAVVVERFRIEANRCVGRVRVEGELWRARAAPCRQEGLVPGREVVVTELVGLWLEVRPLAAPHTRARIPG